jgi:acetyl-CoA carboxylase carboxyltransferase component
VNVKAKTKVVLCLYDFMVLAGTQGWFTHKKMDKMFKLAREQMYPVVLLATGGGGRPGDVDVAPLQVAGLDTPSFLDFASLSGLVPLVGIVSGKCFAGNAALLGCCDLIIAVKGSNIGMGGPAMIQGGGLGTFSPTEIGPTDVQVANGVIDVLVDSEAQACQVAKQYLSYFQGDLKVFSCADQRLLRHVIPENRLHAYNVRTVIELLFDVGSILELRQGFGKGIVTCFARLQGRPIGVLANNCRHLGGAIDTPSAEKTGRFVQLCDAYSVPIVSLVDTPGFLVGPEAEKTAQVRKFGSFFITAADVTVPWISIILRKGYGLGAQVMTGGSFARPHSLFAWPTGEMGGMGLEGAVQLGFSRELNVIEDPVKREVEYQRLVNKMYEAGRGEHMAEKLEIDGVIDPVDTRRVLMSSLESSSPSVHFYKKRRAIL